MPSPCTCCWAPVLHQWAILLPWMRGLPMPWRQRSLHVLAGVLLQRLRALLVLRRDGVLACFAGAAMQRLWR